MRVVILGAGGHGRVVLECAQAMGGFELSAFLEQMDVCQGRFELGIPVYGPLTTPQQLSVTGVLLGIGQNDKRLVIFSRMKAEGFSLPTLIHPSAWVSPSAVLGAATVVMANATVQTGCRLGSAVIINTNASVDHDSELSNGVHVSPGAHLAGNVSVGEGTHIGIGASVIEGIRIGAGCLIAAGAVVVKNVLDGQRVAGVPARTMKTEK